VVVLVATAARLQAWKHVKWLSEDLYHAVAAQALVHWLLYAPKTKRVTGFHYQQWCSCSVFARVHNDLIPMVEVESPRCISLLSAC
jgi:hypothetical protein